MTGRPRTPSNVLKLRGAGKKHPERMKERENEPVNKNPIGEPPGFLTKAEQQIWREIVENSCPGVLTQADRFAVEEMCRLLSKLRLQKKVRGKGGKMVLDKPMLGERQLFSQWCARIGMTPADRSKIKIPPQPSKNRFEDDD